MKRLLALAAATLLAGLALALFLRSESARTGDADAAPVVYPRHEVQAEITAEGLVPYRLRVPKDHEVHLLVQGGPQAPEGMLVLLGYQDVVPAVDMGPGQGREIVFASTRPGDDFALALGGVPIGRLEVTGDHLPEGHR